MRERKTAKVDPKTVLGYVPWVITIISIALYIYANWYYTKVFDDNLQKAMVFASIIIASFSLIIATISLLRRKPKKKIVSMLSLGIAVAQLIIYSTSAGWSADAINFTVAVASLIICTLIIIFSLDGLLERNDTMQMLKPLTAVMLIISLAELIYNLYYLYEYFTPLELLRYFYGELCPVVVYLMLFILLNNKNVMEKRKLREISLPLTLFLAATMVQYGLLYLLNFIPNTSMSREPINIVAFIILILIGLIFIIYRDVDKLTSVSIMMFGIGLFVILTNITKIFSADLYTFFIGVLMTVAGIGCMVMCILMYSGDKYNTKRLKIIMVILVAVAIIPILLTARLHPDAEYVLSNHSDDIMTAFLLVMIYLALSEKSIQYRNVKERMAYNVRIINNSICNDSNAYIFRNDLNRLLGDAGKKMFSDGPIEYERTAELHINGTTATMTLQKWKDQDELYGEIVTDKETTVIQANRFRIAKIIPDDDPEYCGTVTLYGRKGFYIKLLVLDQDETIQASRSRTAIYRILGQSLTISKKRTQDIPSSEDASKQDTKTIE